MVRIPAGARTGTMLRIHGEGEAGHGAPPGDLYVEVHVKDHPHFERDGDDLLYTRVLSFPEAALGTAIEVPTMEKKKARVRIPAGIQDGTVLRLREKGMPRLQGRGKGGKCLDYLRNTIRHLDDLGIPDGPLHRLVKLAEEASS